LTGNVETRASDVDRGLVTVCGAGTPKLVMDDDPKSKVFKSRTGGGQSGGGGDTFPHLGEC